MNLIEAIVNRRSHRGEFQDTPIEESDLNQLIEAARWAPSPFNVQPWEVLIIQESKGKMALADLTEQAITEQFRDIHFLDDNSRWMCTTEHEWHARGDGVLLEDHVTLPQVIHDMPDKLSGNILKRILNSVKSLSLLGHLGIGKLPARDISSQIRESPLLMLIVMNCKRRPPGEGANRWMWLSVGMFIQNLLLAASTLDIGVQFISAPLENENGRKKVKELFKFTNNHEVITLLRMGYNSSEGVNSVRLDTSEFIHFEEYKK